MSFVEIEGVDNVRQVAANLERANRTVGADAARVLRRSAARVETLGKANAPVDTGNLRGSISTEVEGDGRTGVMSAEIGPTASYGAYVELGTSRQPPQPYMFPAADRVAPEFVAALQRLTEPDV